MKREEFKNIIKSVVSEVKQDKNLKTEKQDIRENFRKLIKSVILEVKKSKNTEKDDSKPTKKDDSYLNGEKCKYRNDVNNTIKESSEQLIKKIKNIFKNKDISVIFDDHGDISVKYPEIFSIRINPKWVGIYDIDAYRNLTDRVYAIGLTETQVLDFIKANFGDETKKSYVQTSYEKAIDQTKDKTKKVKELPKSKPVKEKEVAKEEKEDDVKDKKDIPTEKMATVDEKDITRQLDHDVEKNKEMPKVQKLIKKEIDDDLSKNWKK